MDVQSSLMKQDLCPCSSGKVYSRCCEPFHMGELPDTPLQLMRSRYSAYALTLPKYIIETTHKDHKDQQKHESWEGEIGEFCKNTVFHKLEIISFTQEKAEGTVTFIAYLEQKKSRFCLKEKSLFYKVEGKWMYASGEIFT